MIHGQEMLVEKASDQLLEKLLDGESKDLCCQKVEGSIENLADVLEQLNTFSLLSGPKIIWFKEAKLFEGRRNHQQLADQIVEAGNSNDEYQAAKYFLNLCGHLEITLDEVLHGTQSDEALKLLRSQLGTDGLKSMIRYCRSQNWTPAFRGDHVKTLQKAIEKGFPSNHHLLITVNSKVPKNLKLYKTIKEHGWVIDCVVPLGERRADKNAQDNVLRQTVEELLTQSHKKMAPGAFDFLFRYTGFEPRILDQNVKKLIDYVGERTEITEEDIQVVLKRTKVDPVFELTNAIAQRNTSQSLFYLGTLLGAKWHPLQILSAIVNQVRKLLLAKAFVSSEYGKSWTQGMSYPQFQQSAMPAIVAYDKHLREQARGWSAIVTEKVNKKKSKKDTLDVFLAANPNSPYPVYQTLLKSDKYALEELVNALYTLNQADRRLKFSGQDDSIVLKKVIIDICQTKPYGDPNHDS